MLRSVQNFRRCLRLETYLSHKSDLKALDIYRHAGIRDSYIYQMESSFLETVGILLPATFSPRDMMHIYMERHFAQYYDREQKVLHDTIKTMSFAEFLKPFLTDEASTECIDVCSKLDMNYETYICGLSYWLYNRYFNYQTLEQDYKYCFLVHNSIAKKLNLSCYQGTKYEFEYEMYHRVDMLSKEEMLIWISRFSGDMLYNYLNVYPHTRHN